jgi:F-type H+-transporting ATPase subunit delta
LRRIRHDCAYNRPVPPPGGGDPETERLDVSEPVSISVGLAERYASALFELARDGDALKGLETDVDALDAALSGSADLRDLIASPIYSRDDQAAAIQAIAGKMGLSGLVANTLALMAQKRRLFVLPQLLTALRGLIAEAKGEVTAEVASAVALTDAQAAALAETLTSRVGKTVKLKSSVDPSLIGGLVVKVGSVMVDTSIRAKLAAMQNAMKEVG